MKRQQGRYLIIALLIGLGLSAVGAESSASEGMAPPSRVLLVDSTKTFGSTARVGALAGAIRKTGMFELDVRFGDATCPYDDPLACEADRPAAPYDLVVLIPRGIDDGSAASIWVITGILPWTSPDRWPAIAAVSGMIDQVFAGLANAIDPGQDLWPAFTASLYQAQGWLR